MCSSNLQADYQSLSSINKSEAQIAWYTHDMDDCLSMIKSQRGESMTVSVANWTGASDGEAGSASKQVANACQAGPELI